MNYIFNKLFFNEKTSYSYYTIVRLIHFVLSLIFFTNEKWMEEKKTIVLMDICCVTFKQIFLIYRKDHTLIRGIEILIKIALIKNYGNFWHTQAKECVTRRSFSGCPSLSFKTSIWTFFHLLRCK